MRGGGEKYSDYECILKKEPRGSENKLNDDFKFLAGAAGKMRCPWDFPGKVTWSGLPFPSPGDLPNPGVESGSPPL